MNEEPKGIWKKSWGWLRWLQAWLIIMAVIFFIALIVYLCGGIPGGPPGFWPELFFLLTGSLITATVLVGLWAFTRWFLSRRNFKRFLFGLACFVTLIALFYAEEDWRGKHDWEQFKHQWEAKGEKFDWQSIVPPPVPDDQNFAFSPVWIAEIRFNFRYDPKRAEAWYGNRIDGEEVSRILPLLPVSVSGLVGTNWAYRMPPTPEASGNWTTAHMTDLKPWQAYYRGLEETNPMAKIPIASRPQSPAADVLLALSKFDPVIEQLRQDSARPYSRFPVLYDTDDPAAILIPHLAALKRYCQVLQLRALAELQNGQSEPALADIKLALRLADSVRTEPFIITHLVRIAIVQITLQPVYEGLAGHKWSDGQLVELDSELAKQDFLADYESSLQGEQAAHIQLITWLEQKRGRYRELFNYSSDDQRDMMNKFWTAAIFYLEPKGWFYQNDLVLARLHQQWVAPMVDARQHTVSPKAIQQGSQAELNLRHTPFNFFARLVLPALGNYAQKAAYAQSSVDLARTAMALERYRLVHGEYPESLDALAPQFVAKLPHDVINGQPLHYRRTSDGQFVLYSVGWNETDDGGVVGLTTNGENADNRKGDWVWRYPAR